MASNPDKFFLEILQENDKIIFKIKKFFLKNDTNQISLNDPTKLKTAEEVSLEIVTKIESLDLNGKIPIELYKFTSDFNVDKHLYVKKANAETTKNVSVIVEYFLKNFDNNWIIIVDTRKLPLENNQNKESLENNPSLLKLKDKKESLESDLLLKDLQPIHEAYKELQSINGANEEVESIKEKEEQQIIVITPDKIEFFKNSFLLQTNEREILNAGFVTPAELENVKTQEPFQIEEIKSDSSLDEFIELEKNIQIIQLGTKILKNFTNNILYNFHFEFTEKIYESISKNLSLVEQIDILQNKIKTIPCLNKNVDLNISNDNEIECQSLTLKIDDLSKKLLNECIKIAFDTLNKTELSVFIKKFILFLNILLSKSDSKINSEFEKNPEIYHYFINQILELIKISANIKKSDLDIMEIKTLVSIVNSMFKKDTINQLKKNPDIAEVSNSDILLINSIILQFESIIIDFYQFIQNILSLQFNLENNFKDFQNEANEIKGILQNKNIIELYVNHKFKRFLKKFLKFYRSLSVAINKFEKSNESDVEAISENIEKVKLSLKNTVLSIQISQKSKEFFNKLCLEDIMKEIEDGNFIKKIFEEIMSSFLKKSLIYEQNRKKFLEDLKQEAFKRIKNYNAIKNFIIDQEHNISDINIKKTKLFTIEEEEDSEDTKSKKQIENNRANFEIIDKSSNQNNVSINSNDIVIKEEILISKSPEVKEYKIIDIHSDESTTEDTSAFKSIPDKESESTTEEYLSAKEESDSYYTVSEIEKSHSDLDSANEESDLHTEIPTGKIAVQGADNQNNITKQTHPKSEQAKNLQSNITNTNSKLTDTSLPGSREEVISEAAESISKVHEPRLDLLKSTETDLSKPESLKISLPDFTIPLSSDLLKKSKIEPIKQESSVFTGPVTGSYTEIVSSHSPDPSHSLILSHSPDPSDSSDSPKPKVKEISKSDSSEPPKLRPRSTVSRPSGTGSITSSSVLEIKSLDNKPELVSGTDLTTLSLGTVSSEIKPESRQSKKISTGLSKSKPGPSEPPVEESVTNPSESGPVTESSEKEFTKVSLETDSSETSEISENKPETETHSESQDLSQIVIGSSKINLGPPVEETITSQSVPGPVTKSSETKPKLISGTGSSNSNLQVKIENLNSSDENKSKEKDSKSLKILILTISLLALGSTITIIFIVKKFY